MMIIFARSILLIFKNLLTSDSLSKRANNSFNVLTNSGAEHVDDMAVKPTMSANNMLNNQNN